MATPLFRWRKTPRSVARMFPPYKTPVLILVYIYSFVSATSVPEAGDATSLVLPLARVRKTVRLDPSVGSISKEGLLAVAKATELFMAMIADKAWKIGRQVD